MTSEVVDRFQIGVAVPVEVRLGDGGVYVATSKLVRGLLVVSQDKDSLAVKTRDALGDLLLAIRDDDLQTPPAKV